jgi:DNA helicase-2/ATP-dependent DNA helicase PcrA
MSFTPSTYQSAILDAYKNSSSNIIIQAVAGAGKTTTLLMLAACVKNTPAVLCAFNNHIAKDISNKLNAKKIMMEGRTIHSLGFSCVRDNFIIGQVNSKKYQDIAKRWISGRRGYYSNSLIDWAGMLKDLLDFTRLTLTDPSNSQAMESMIRAYDLEGDARMVDAVPNLLEEAASQDFIAKHSIDFTDMIWLPVKNKLQPKKYMEMFVDEAQDLNVLQAEFISMSLHEKGRAIFCGDPRQAIMGFSGADANSFYNIKEKFSCVELPLTYCYRCGSAIVEKAKTYVSHIEVPESAHVGQVSYIDEASLLSKIQPGDAVLCRKNAPLIDLCLALISINLPARVRGRDMVSKLGSHVKKASSKTKIWKEEFITSLENYRESEIASLVKKGMEEKIDSFNDTINCIIAVYDPAIHFCEDDLRKSISDLFSDETEGIVLSSVHRAKGLEWSRVFIYKPSTLPLRWKNQTKSQAEQEINLAYVAVTRAMHDLIFVKELSK